MTEFLNLIADVFKNFQWFYILEIITYFVLICFSFSVLKENKAKSVIGYFCLVGAIISTCLILLKLQFPTFKGTPYFLGALALFVISVVILFATEIKRAIWNKRSAINTNSSSSVEDDKEKVINEIIKAIQNMSKNDIGAIIILSNGNLPNGVLESGVSLNAEISSELIESIFFPKTALHDGAMILSEDKKIQAAGCFLPLAQEVNLSKELGSRHRAGIGLTETVNVTAIIVSEETGIISIAKGGKIIRYVDTEYLKGTLKEFYWKDFL